MMRIISTDGIKSSRKKEEIIKYSWTKPLRDDLSELMAISDIWTVIYQFIDAYQVGAFLLVSKSHNDWVRKYLHQFDASILTTVPIIPLRRNLFPNLRYIKMILPFNNRENFWSLADDALPHLEILDIDYRHTYTCPIVLLEWISKHSIKKYILRNKVSDCHICAYQYGLISVEEFHIVNPELSRHVYESILRNKNLKILRISGYDQFHLHSPYVKAFNELIRQNPSVHFIFDNISISDNEFKNYPNLTIM